MKCIIATILALLPILSTTANAMDKPLAIMGSGQQQQVSTIDFDEFSDVAMSKVRETISIGQDLHIQLDGMIKVASKDPSVMPHLKKYLQHCMANYKPGMQFDGPTEIEISKKDEINISYFAQFVLDELMPLTVLHQEISKEFSNHKELRTTPFNSFDYRTNNLLFALLYYDGKAEIKNRYNSYNNLQFIISKCLDEKSGKDMGFSFETSRFNSSEIKLDTTSKNTIKVTLYACGGMTWAEAHFKVSIFKLAEENSFRVQVELFSADNQYDKELRARKISNFHLLIK